MAYSTAGKEERLKNELEQKKEEKKKIYYKKKENTNSDNKREKKLFLSRIMIKNIETFIAEHRLIPNESAIVLGLSGGPDSVFLLHLLSQLQKKGKVKKLIAAHLDHQWRTSSDKDAQFCLDIAKKYGVSTITQKISDLKISLKFEGSKEEFGRRARRYFFEKIKKENNCDLIALAHHAQDQQETFFIRLIRGSSLSGLTAMKPKHGVYIRPLLETNKKDILDFLKQNNVPYLIDPSNVLEDFLRNRIRKHVIPALAKCDKRFDKNFFETLGRLKKTEQFLEQLTEKTFAEIATEKTGNLCVNLKKLLHLHPVLQYRVIMHWLIKQNVTFPVTEGFLDEIVRFLHQPGSKEHQIHHDWTLVKKKELVHIKKL